VNWSALATFLSEQPDDVVSLSGLTAESSDCLKESYKAYLFRDEESRCALIFDGRLFNSSESLSLATTSTKQSAVDVLSVYIESGSQGILGLDGQFNLVIVD
jgi:hypothetical protein